MAYVSLYRKYRPQTFAEVIGQAHVTTTLAHAVAEDRLHHAYLFTGPRGTGKTSTARILAKSLNCENGPTAEPCNTCTHCAAITTGSSVDVIEIDAASHGGVDDVRDLRDRVAFAPASARMKVYIVDECHMLSTAGWNAFLKTVEEPPGHVVFVFATTEPHKVLETILSRTQRFDFKRVDAATLAAHVRDLAARESLEVEPGAIDLIVRAGDGSVRDTLSVLDQVAAFTGRTAEDGAAAPGAVTARDVGEVLGAAPDELVIEAADLVASGDVAQLCVLVQRLADGGHDLRQFAREAVEHLRALFLLRVAPDAGLVEAAPERLERLRAQSARLRQIELVRAMELLGEAQAQMRRGSTRLPLEIALIKAAIPDASGDAAALAARLDRLERSGVSERRADQGLSVSAEAASASAPAAPPEPDPAPQTLSAPEADPAPDTLSAPEADPAPETLSAPEADPAPETVSAPPAAVAEIDLTDSAADEDGAGGPAEPLEEASSAPVHGDLAQIQERWPEVLAATKQRKRTLHAFLTEGRPVALDGGALTLEFRAGYDFHADNCTREESQALLGLVFTEVLGGPLRVRSMIAEAAVGGSRRAQEADETGIDSAELSAVLEREADEAAGAVPDDAEAQAKAIDTLTQHLGATVLEDPADR
ncbi:MAG TPA: DNA polymerase III subunit gamma/tau [Egibacteraceae bacterium]|nr:DNA polymerase III subunit gamma/tau [Egibacteraceae bacterium]